MKSSDSSKFDFELRHGLGASPAADFEVWQSRHSDSLAYLNPVITATYHRRRLLLVRLASLATAAVIVAAAGMWMLAPQKHAFAQTVKTINEAETIKWTIVWYDRIYSEDGKRTWLRRHPRWERAYLAPSRWRDVSYADDGTVSSVSIEDTATGEVLRLDMKKKTAMLKREPSGQFGRGGPFSGIATILESKSIEFAGQRQIDDVKVNVFRHHREFPHGQREGYEIWLDAESKRLIGYCTTPGDDYFDPDTASDRDNPAEEKFSKGTIAGVIKRDIVFDAQLDPALFSMTPPDGFTIVEPPQRPKITEDQMVTWLRLSAQANEGIFLELERGFNLEWHNAIAEKAKSERTEAEQRYMDVARRHMLDGNYRPLLEFSDEFTQAGSFRYLGKGVRLGSVDSIVCFYKLNSTGKYRAVFGDLRVMDIDAKDLPLPVE